MCDVNKIREKEQELEDYLEFVNTDIDKKLMYDMELYAAYAAYNDKVISEINDWYWDAENELIGIWSPESYLLSKYEVVSSEHYNAVYDREVHDKESIYESGNYWFETQ